MKITKRLVTKLLIFAMFITIVMTFQVKLSKAANYLSAPILPLNGTWSSDYYLTGMDDDHWYKIVIPSDGKLNLQIRSYFESCHWVLYNNDLTHYITSDYLYYGEETTPETNKTDIILSSGIYYVEINTSGYETGKYNIYGKFTSYEVNDQAAISYVSPLNYQLGSTITGALTETDEEDWYKINILTDGFYSLTVASYLGMYIGEDSLNWKLYNNDLTNNISYGYACGYENAPTTEKEDVALSKGIYYLKVYSNTAGKYTFRFNTLTQQNCTHNYDSKYYDATYFKRGYTVYRCNKCGHAYTGNYKPVKKLGRGDLDSYYGAGKRKLKLSWSIVSDASGYQIRYSRKRNMNSAVIKKVKGQYKTSKTISKLARRKKYYVQVRAYKKSGSKTVYGKWSSKRAFKTN